MISASPFKSLRATGTPFWSTSMHLSSPIKGSSDTPWIMRLPGLSPRGRHGSPEVSLGSHSNNPCEASHAIGCCTVMLMSKSVSCHPALQPLVPQELLPLYRLGLQIFVGELLQWPLALIKKQRAETGPPVRQKPSVQRPGFAVQTLPSFAPPMQCETISAVLLMRINVST